jgi:hypothetical protein
VHQGRLDEIFASADNPAQVCERNDPKNHQKPQGFHGRYGGRNRALRSEAVMGELSNEAKLELAGR